MYIYIYIYREREGEIYVIVLTQKRKIKAAKPNIYVYQVALLGLKPGAIDGKRLVYGR